MTILHQTLFLLQLLSSASAVAIRNNTGFFWHVTDMHWDPTYNSTAPGVSCGSKQKLNYGALGDYLCDSPWTLTNSSIYAMKTIHESVDFIIWTGDDTPHNADLTKDQVAGIISDLTSKIVEVFPNTTVFPVLGNHDWSPKNQIPPRHEEFYGRIAEIWSKWITTPNANQTFLKGGYYQMEVNENLVLVGLNTNLYYKSNDLTVSMPDPGNQLQWLDDTLTSIAENNVKVILIGHVPPGKFEKHLNYDWYRSYYNQIFTELLRKHSDVIGSSHFAHHHTDSFRIVYDSKVQPLAGDPVSSILLAPSVTPWETTLPGVMDGAANNPAIRLVQYDRKTGTIEDIHQYYLNLTRANTDSDPTWELEYRATEFYEQPDMTSQSLDRIAKSLWTDDGLFDKYFSVNDVLFEPEVTWTSQSRLVHCCAITELDYTNYTNCLNEHVINSGQSLFSRACIFFVLFSSFLVQFTSYQQ